MLEKIISGGQTGVDRAALDAAQELSIARGGWCPKGRRAEDGAIADRYPLVETPLASYSQRTQWNVRDSDATLVLVWGKPSSGTAFTIASARRRKKPCLVVDCSKTGARRLIKVWIAQEHIRVLNVAGPRESTHPGAYQDAFSLLRKVLRQ